MVVFQFGTTVRALFWKDIWMVLAFNPEAELTREFGLWHEKRTEKKRNPVQKVEFFIPDPLLRNRDIDRTGIKNIVVKDQQADGIKAGQTRGERQY